jgi:hypothetical protein
MVIVRVMEIVYVMMGGQEKTVLNKCVQKIVMEMENAKVHNVFAHHLLLG